MKENQSLDNGLISVFTCILMDATVSLPPPGKQKIENFLRPVIMSNSPSIPCRSKRLKCSKFSLCVFDEIKIGVIFCRRGNVVLFWGSRTTVCVKENGMKEKQEEILLEKMPLWTYDY